MNTGAGDALTFAWTKQSEWSQAASNAKAALFRLRFGALSLTVAAAVLATLSIQLSGLSAAVGTVLGAAATLALGVLAILQSFTKPEKIQDWTRARSVGEALKAETFTYLAGVTPYRGADRDEKFLVTVDGVLADAADLSRLTVGVVAKQRALPAVVDVTSYTTLRIDQQIDEYYKPQSVLMRKRANQFRWIQIGLSAVALVLSFASTVTGRQGFLLWAPVIATVIASVAAFTAVQRYAALSEEYARTYEQLQRLKLTRGDASGSDPAAADDAFVADAERVISIQNESWMARSIAVAQDEAGGE